MKRLTTYRADGRAAIANNENATPKQKVLKIPKVIDRLAAIEDILGDEYDLDRLRELAQADKDGKIKAYIVDSFYCDICQKRHARTKEIEVYLTRNAAEVALSERR